MIPTRPAPKYKGSANLRTREVGLEPAPAGQLRLRHPLTDLGVRTTSLLCTSVFRRRRRLQLHEGHISLLALGTACPVRLVAGYIKEHITAPLNPPIVGAPLSRTVLAAPGVVNSALSLSTSLLTRATGTIKYLLVLFFQVQVQLQVRLLPARVLIIASSVP